MVETTITILNNIIYFSITEQPYLCLGLYFPSIELIGKNQG